MKWLVKILALYFLMIAFMPCHDAAVGCSMACSSAPTTHQESSNDTHQDSCPPLCACSCCGITGAISPKTIVWETFISKPTRIHMFQYTSPSGISFHDLIWHPPKII